MIMLLTADPRYSLNTKLQRCSLDDCVRKEEKERGIDANCIEEL